MILPFILPSGKLNYHETCLVTINFINPEWKVQNGLMIF